MAKAEGLKIPFNGEETIKPEFLEPAKFDSPTQLIEIMTDEFSAVCPWSGLPDIARVEIRYLPTGGLIVELKSLKYYFLTYRTVGVYQERVTQLIHEHLSKLLKTDVEVCTIYHTRGGIDVTCTEGSLDKTITVNKGENNAG